MNGNAVFALALLSVVLFFVVGALDYDELARQVPLIVGIPTAGLLIIQFLVQLFPRAFARLDRSDTSELIQVDETLLTQAEASRRPRRDQRRELELHAWIGGFILAIYVAGFLVAIPGFLFGLVYFRLREKLWVTVVTVAVMWIVAYVGFQTLMEVPLFKGVFWE
jgi:ABC-type branched-subunit amino acid transport system permease subunit